VPNFASDILVSDVRTKIPLISISFSSLVLIFALVLVSSTIIQNVFVIFDDPLTKVTDYDFDCFVLSIV